MADNFVAEIRIVPFNFAPTGWALCDGQLLSISQNTALFSLLGTTYGGDGQSTFALPDLRGRLPIHLGPGFGMGAPGGSENVTLTTLQMPAHTHQVSATTGANTASLPGGNFLAQGPDIYETNKPGNNTMQAAISSVGGSQPHNNLQPYLCVNFILSMFGVYPSQT